MVFNAIINRAWVACLLSSGAHALAAFTAHNQVLQEATINYKDDMNRKYLCVLLNVLVHSCARRRSAAPRIFLSSTTWNLHPSPYPLPLISDQYCPFQINTVCEV